MSEKQQMPLRNNKIVFASGSHTIGASIDLGNAPSKDVISNEATFTDCRIRLWRSGGFTLGNAAFHRCTLQSMAVTNGVKWGRCALIDCSFLGTYRGCIFGGKPLDSAHGGRIERGDFSQANLHLCEFYGFLHDLPRFPGWPCVTILSPRNESSDWLSLSFSGWFHVLQQVIAESSAELAAVTFHWPTVRQEFGLTESEEAAQSRFVGKSYIFF
jgi:hypothetical protein